MVQWLRKSTCQRTGVMGSTPGLLSSQAANAKAHALRQQKEKRLQGEAHGQQRETSPCLLQLKRAFTRQQRPSAAISKSGKRITKSHCSPSTLIGLGIISFWKAI